MTKFIAFLNDESGASAAEYVLILAIIGSAIVIAAGAAWFAVRSLGLSPSAMAAPSRPPRLQES